MTYTNTNQIGEITETKGVATIIRSDGSEEPAALGTPIFQGDIVETTGDGAVNIGFADDSSFAVSDDARITIDEFVFDPETEGGAQDFSVARGVFMYTSGLIGRENPDSVEIDTPVGAIGIRGTIIGGDIQPNGESQVTVIEGAIVVHNDAGEQLLTNQFDTVKLVSRGVAPSDVQQLSVNDIANNFDSIKDVSSSLFSSFQDQMEQQQDSQTNDAGNDQSPEADAEQKAEDQAQDDAVEDIAEDTVEHIETAAEETDDTETLEENLDKSVETLEEAIETKATDADTAREKIQNIQEKRQQVREKMAERKAETEQKAEEEQQQTDANNAQDDADNIDINVLNETINDTTGTAGGTTTAPSLVLSTISGAGSIDENQDGSTTAISVGTIGLTTGTVAGAIYSISGASDFTIDSSTGEVFYTGSGADFETDSNFTFDVTVTSTDGETETQSFEVELNDVNEFSEITNHADTNPLQENEGGLAADISVADLTFIEVDGSTPDQTTFTTDDNRFNVQWNGSQLELVAITGASFDFESEPVVAVNISQTDGLNSYADYAVNVTVDDVNEAAVISSNFADRFDVTNNIDGVLALDSFGAKAFKINIDDPEMAAFSVGDFGITGSIGGQAADTIFEIMEPAAGKFFLALQSGYQIIDAGGGNLQIHDGTSNIGGPFSDVFSLGINLNDGGQIASMGVSLTAQTVQMTTSGGSHDVAVADVVFGNTGDETFKLINDDFKFIKGGQGHDIIKLDGINLGAADTFAHTFDLTDTVSNLVGNSADLKSIEEFRFVDSYDELEINIEDLIDLLKTSENGEVIFSSGETPSTTGSPDSVNGIHFKSGGSDDQLTNHGFSDMGTVMDGPETYQKFTHTELGDVLIETDISGASMGGL